MALITVDILVEDIALVLTHFDRVKVYRSTTGALGIFTEITLPGPVPPETRIPLVAGQSTYAYDDLSGDAAYYYCVSYYNTTTLLESSKSEATPGERHPALDILTVDELKTFYLFGLDLTDDEGTPMPPSLYEHYIKASVSWLEAKLDIAITSKVITQEKHDFYRNDYYTDILLQTFMVPILDVTKVEMVLPGGVSIIEYEDGWIYDDKASGQINIIPGSGQQVALGLSGAWLPFVMGRRKFLPHTFRIDYTAGFLDVPDVIKDAVGMYASFGPLGILGDLLGGAGIASQSISLDGLSQSFNTTSSATNAGFGARIIQFQKQLKDILPQLRRSYHPISLEVV